MTDKALKYALMALMAIATLTTAIYIANIKNVRVNIEFSTYTPE